jgi:electron transport complex protein RnfB
MTLATRVRSDLQRVTRGTLASDALVALAVALLLGDGERTVVASVFVAVLVVAASLRYLRTPRAATHAPTAAEPRDALAARIDRLLPQTQCGQCGYAGCRPYADAIAHGTAEINQCPPGGAAGIRALAELLQRPRLPLNPANGIERPKALAVIDEATCIGCTKCIQACPVDAIIGAPKLMHTVIAELCTGCELCLPPCPVDCIDMLVAGAESEIVSAGPAH